MVDYCPEDVNKIDPGVCGCGIPDADSDEDSVLDCQDNCPFIPGTAENDGCIQVVPVECTSDEQCDDNDPCTSNSCTNNQCDFPVNTTDTTCDGVDDDCDGQYDEDAQDYTESVEQGTGCFVDVLIVCDKTEDGTSTQILLTQEICGNNSDDDCDGLTDETDCVEECVANEGDTSDSDQDGIPACADNCPTVSGTALNYGCPENTGSFCSGDGDCGVGETCVDGACVVSEDPTDPSESDASSGSSGCTDDVNCLGEDGSSFCSVATCTYGSCTFGSSIYTSEAPDDPCEETGCSLKMRSQRSQLSPMVLL